MSRPFKRIESEYSPQQIAKLQIRRVIEGICADDLILCEVVAQGEKVWRATMREAFAPVMDLPDEICDRAYLFFCGAVQARFTLNQDHAEAMHLAGEFLDQVQPVTPPTQAEIDKSWVIEEASHPDAIREQYGDKSPQQWLDEAIADGHDKGID